MKVLGACGSHKRVSSAVALLTLCACLLPALAQAALPDGRGLELVTPIEKNGGGVGAPETLAGGGVFQAAADGNSISYGSASAFGGGQGAPEGSQYLSTHGSGGWLAQNITVPIFSGSYGTEADGVPYQLFSSDLSRSLLLSGRHCRGTTASDCPVANPPLAGTDAPAGYQNYYLRNAGGGFEALLGPDDVANTDIGPADFELTFAGATADLSHVVLSSCAALSADATEVTLGAGCDPTKQNLYERSAGASGLTLINTAPGAELAAQSNAISTNGSRVYFTQGANLYLHEAASNTQVDADAGGGGSFETASADGSLAFFAKAGHLYRYDVAGGLTTDLTPTGDLQGVLGASADGSYLYYLTADGLYLIHGGSPIKVAAAPQPLSEATAEPSNYPPTTGAARVSADGTHLLFSSKASLTGYDNTDSKTGQPDAELFLYGSAGAGQLRCVSCRSGALRPSGPSSVPGAIANGEQIGATRAYKPRALSADGSRVFFDSTDVLASGDTNNESDVFQWEAQGPGCAKAPGCVSSLSGGKAEGGARFIDASANGNDAFFATDGSLLSEDPGSVDLYDARVGGGFPAPLVAIPCFGDSCQQLPSEPVDPGLSTEISGPGNPAVHYVKHGHAAKHKKHGKGKNSTKKHTTKKGAR